MDIDSSYTLPALSAFGSWPTPSEPLAATGAPPMTVLISQILHAGDRPTASSTAVQKR